MNYRMIRYIIGTLIQMEAVLFLLPAFTALFYKEATCIAAFLGSALFCVVGGHLVKGKKPEDVTIFSSEGYVSVAVCWVMLSICGAMPLYFSGYFPNPVDALFEIVSGFTTTGATILGDVEVLPRSVLMWRSFSHWVGGMGVLVFMLALLPMAGASSMYLMRAESPGPSVGKLVPKVSSTAKILYAIYFILTVAEFLLLMLAGCPLFDSVNLSFATAGTGGFGVLNSSAGDYNAAIQIILTVFMILFGVNFNLYFLICLRKWKEAFQNEELHIYLGIIAGAVAVITIDILHQYGNVMRAFRYASFQVAAIITTTGFCTADWNLWPELSKTVLLSLLVVGACAGSTGGGIKVSRLMILLKSIKQETKRMLHPKAVTIVRVNGRKVSGETMNGVYIYFICYIMILLGSVLLVAFNNFDFGTTFSAVLTTLNNVGPGISLVGPVENFSQFSGLSKAVFCVDMLVGRLEIFPYLMLLSPELWRRRF